MLTFYSLTLVSRIKIYVIESKQMKITSALENIKKMIPERL